MYQYCEQGTCTAFKGLGEPCTHKYQCGRTATCWFNSATSIYGVCTEYMKVTSGAATPVWQTIGSTNKIEEDSHLLCESLYMNPSTGLCEEPSTNANKGKACSSDSECGTAACECGWNNNGDKYCGILEGDEEWVDARTKFKTYYEATKDTCSSAERWGECSESGKYYSWKCAELKAQHYTMLLEHETTNLTCMNTLKPDLPTFKEIEEVCAKAGATYMAVGLGLLAFILY